MTENGFEYVDLGLPSKIMWATCNVGADKLEDPGLLFQFGRVDGYRYNDRNNKFRIKEQNKQDTGSEYIPQTTSGKIYNVGEILDLKDDAAHVNMGGKWKMPTQPQYQDMFNNTIHDVVTINGIKGMMFTSIINGCQLFIPFGGWWFSGKYYNVGQYAFVWSSQVLDSYIRSAYSLYCNSGGPTLAGAISANYFDFRSYGFSVRGVFKK